MDIKGLDYNTQREKLIMPEYGREIQKMVDHAIGLASKAERQKCAQAIVKMMESNTCWKRANQTQEWPMIGLRLVDRREPGFHR